jgi:large conductance mechanosensitive channel
MLKELREFAVKGNVVDMAVGIMIGAAFTTVVKSVVDDLIMPPIGLATGGLDFSSQYVALRAPEGADLSSLTSAREAGATVIAYGQFINHTVSFLLVALVLFFIVKWINRLRRPDTPPAPSSKACPFCTSVINLAATRCPQCTSELGPETPAKAS